MSKTIPRCTGHGGSCGEVCWAQEYAEEVDFLTVYGACSGAVHACEEYPDIWIHYCDGHGLPEEFWEGKEEAMRMAVIEQSLGKLTT